MHFTSVPKTIASLAGMKFRSEIIHIHKLINSSRDQGGVKYVSQEKGSLLPLVFNPTPVVESGASVRAQKSSRWTVGFELPRQYYAVPAGTDYMGMGGAPEREIRANERDIRITHDVVDVRSGVRACSNPFSCALNGILAGQERGLNMALVLALQDDIPRCHNIRSLRSI